MKPQYLYLEAELPLVKLGEEHEDTEPGLGPFVLGLELGEEVGEDDYAPFPLVNQKMCPCGRYVGRCGDPTSCNGK